MSAFAQKLGKLPPRHDPRSLKLARYLDRAELPSFPERVEWSTKVPAWPMFLNDQIGDCTCASAAHGIRVWTANASGAPAPISEAEVLHAYEAVGGYRPGDPSTDNGAVELDVLRYWRKAGIGGHRIGAFASVDPRNSWLVKAAIWLFGGLYLGLALPKTIEGQKVWSVVDPRLQGDSTPGSLGGHAVWAMDIDPAHIRCATWGGVQPMSRAFFEAYCDEAHAVISQDWISAATEKCPAGFDLSALERDLAAVTR